jgi:hypothetical protein
MYIAIIKFLNKHIKIKLQRDEGPPSVPELASLVWFPKL